MKYLLKQRWWWISLIIIFLVLLYVHQNAYHRLKNDQIERTFEDLRTKAELAKILLDIFPIDSSNVIDLQRLAQRTKQQIGVRVTFIASDGIVAADSDVKRENVTNMDNHINRPEVQQATTEEFGKSYRFSNTVKNNLFYVALPFEKPGLFSGFIRLSYYSEKVETWISAIKTVFIISFFSNTLALWFIISFILYSISKSWRKVSEVAQTVAAGEKPEIPKRIYSGDSGVIVNALETMLDKIKKERQYLQEALNSLEEAIAVIDDNYKIIIRNTQLEKQFNYGKPISEGENILQIIQSSEVLNSLSHVYKSSKADDFEFKFLKQQEKRFYYAHIQPIEHYEKKRFFMYFKDISSLKKLQAIRKDFVANVSHEMKTPIASLIGYFETLLDHPNIPTNQRQLYLRRSLIQAKKMQALIADLLQISDLEQGKEINFVHFSLKELLEEVISNHHHKANRKNHTIELNLSNDDLIIEGDPKGIGVVVDNLLQNAISYTPEGGKIKIYTTDLENEKISVFVKDTGVGIESKYLDRIFQRFYRVHESRDIHQTGTGLGLSIVKHIIEAHGEHVGASSKQGGGSTFWFTLKKAI